MDVRLSPEQQALRDSAAQVVDRLGPQRRRPARRRRAGRPSSTPPSPPSGWRELRTADRRRRAVGVGRRGRARRRGARPRPGRRRRSSARPWPPSCAAWPAPRRATAAETVVLDAGPGGAGRCRRRQRARRRAWPSTPRRATVGARARRRRRAAHGSARWRCRPGDGARRPDPAGRRRSTRRDRRSPLAGQAAPLTDDDLARWTALGLALTCADLVGIMRGAVELAARLRRRAPAVRRGHRLVPGRAAPAGRRLRRRRRGRAASPLHAAWAVDALAAGGRARRRRGGQGLLRPGRPHGVRDRHPGARRHRQHLGVPGPRLPAPGAAVERRARRRRAPASTGCSPTTGIGGGTMDFGDSPDEAAFRARLRDVAGRPTTPACRPRRPTTTTGPARPPGTSRSTTPGSSACPGPRTSAARACRASTT